MYTYIHIYIYIYTYIYIYIYMQLFAYDVLCKNLFEFWPKGAVIIFWGRDLARRGLHPQRCGRGESLHRGLSALRHPDVASTVEVAARVLPGGALAVRLVVKRAWEKLGEILVSEFLWWNWWECSKRCGVLLCFFWVWCGGFAETGEPIVFPDFPLWLGWLGLVCLPRDGYT